ncbi:MAG: hypothetical protein EWV50_00160 [Microcystis aeruginosa Ma_MB_F_20061100_S20]|uniref:Uncharacterized protein n=1 Tax=Microcystis aeruginosa Ma_MB_F_20061100_S20D TaxID=2486253 RepID=A0A552EPE0_MICAE|nr:MAG: hypothetical protein EWV78_09315 [Microcystis aeruginosa Ma_MB_F_20061100_S20D]TRU43543.1 MAG: hypothetical protein EWV50_00160 [Microcystis aeruginosa Ma_MB_F_20061100_S20]
MPIGFFSDLSCTAFKLRPHFPTSPLPHFPTSPLPHFPTSPLPHFPTSPHPTVSPKYDQLRPNYCSSRCAGFRTSDRTP